MIAVTYSKHHDILLGKLVATAMILACIQKEPSLNIATDSCNPDSISQFSQSLQAKSVVMTETRLKRFLQQPFQVIIH
jgi:hypothetical protein